MERYHKFAALHRQAATESAAGLPALDRCNYVQRELGLMWGDLSEEAKAEYHVGVDEPLRAQACPSQKGRRQPAGWRQLLHLSCPFPAAFFG